MSSTREPTNSGAAANAASSPAIVESMGDRLRALEDDKAVSDMEEIISNALRYGVLISFVIILAGSIWFFLSGHAGYANLSTAGKDAAKALTTYHSGSGHAPTTPGSVVTGLLHGKPYALIALGLLVLIATPVVRVAVSVVTFLWERDRLYAIITAYVLAVLIVSFLIGKGG